MYVSTQQILLKGINIKTNKEINGHPLKFNLLHIQTETLQRHGDIGELAIQRLGKNVSIMITIYRRIPAKQYLWQTSVLSQALLVT